MNRMRKIVISALLVTTVLGMAVIGKVALTYTKQTKPEPLVINTVERQDDIVLTVMRGEEEVFQYAGDIELWKGDDGKAYGIIYLDGEEVTQ